MEAEEPGTVCSGSPKQGESQNNALGNNPSPDSNHTEEKIQRSALEKPGENPCPRPDGALCKDAVLCDSCIESPREAKKSCLTCLVSYCEDHLRPHLEKEKFQSHKLVEPLKDVDTRVCETHNLPLELYCCVETCCVCQECGSDQHYGHEILPITEARQRLEVQQNKSCASLLLISTSLKLFDPLGVDFSFSCSPPFWSFHPVRVSPPPSVSLIHLSVSHSHLDLRGMTLL